MFKLKKINKNGVRLGLLETPHGVLSTPLFMPDATRGFLKSLNTKDIKNTGTQAMVVNTFHLYLQPGIKIIKKAGGIHHFMNWSGPLLSDSGGFQVFSLIHQNPKMGKISDEKVSFKSPLDGSWHDFTPEKSIQIQFDLGVDMMVCLDDCPPHDLSFEKMKAAVDRTILWAARSKKEYEKQIKKRRINKEKRPLLFSVIQGGTDISLRRYCAQKLVAMDFDGYSFGARPIDKNGNFLKKILQETANCIPPEVPRFALGVGTPNDIKRCALLGWDMFDCVIPTREGRHGRLFLGVDSKQHKTINILNSKFSSNFKEINKNSDLLDLRENSLAYLHHLFRLKESSGQRLASLNNLEFYQKKIKDLY